MSTVKLVLSKEGQLVSVSKNNPEWGSIRMESATEEYNNGIINYRTRVAFLQGRLKDLATFVNQYGVTVTGSEVICAKPLVGRIVVMESLDQLEVFPAKADGTTVDATHGIKYISAAAKEHNLPCTLDDQPIYRKTFFSKDVNALDTLVAHNNREQITLFRKEQGAIATKGADIRGNGRLAELQAIPKAKRTAEQKAELAELMD